MIDKKFVAIVCVAALIGSAFGFIMVEEDKEIKEEKKRLTLDPFIINTYKVKVGDKVNLSFEMEAEITEVFEVKVNDLSYSCSGPVITITGTITNTPTLTFFAVVYTDYDSTVLELTFDVTDADCTIKFNANGGSCSLSSKTVTKGTSITLPKATKSGCTFLGWYSSSSDSGKLVGEAGDTITLTSNRTVYAHYQENSVTITSTVQDPYTVVGTTFVYDVTTAPSNATITITGAPSWLTVSNHRISGTPTSAEDAGSYYIVITATSGSLKAAQSFTLEVSPVLDFTSVPTGGIIVLYSEVIV